MRDASVSATHALARDADEEGLAILALRLGIEADASVGVAEQAAGVRALRCRVHEGTEAGQERMESVMIRPRRRQRRPHLPHRPRDIPRPRSCED
jgi:hypothetical protein